MLDINSDYDTAEHPDSESGDIDKTIKLSFQELAPGDPKKVSKHLDEVKWLPFPQIYAIPAMSLDKETNVAALSDSGQFLFVNDTAGPKWRGYFLLPASSE